MEIKEIGKKELLKRIGDIFKKEDNLIYGQRCAVEKSEDGYRLTSTFVMSEGVHFDLTYTPLRHLGFKAVVGALTNICAMNGRGGSISVGVALSSRFSVEATQDLYRGFDTACRQYGVSYLGGELTASLTGLLISVTAVGSVDEDKITLNSSAKSGDIICVTNDLGAAYCGVKLLEREKRVLKGNNISKPEFAGFEYLLGRQLKPTLESGVVEALADAKIVPSAMTAITDSLASDLRVLCEASSLGATIYLDRLPIAKESFDLCEKINFDPVIAAINGGDDFALLFTLPATKYEEVVRIGGINVIGHTNSSKDIVLSTPDGSMIDITSPGEVTQQN